MKLYAALLMLLCGTSLATAQETDTLAQQGNKEAIVAWLRQHAIPIQHFEAGHGFADLQPLKKILRDVRIVGLGEATHGTREFFQFKHRMLEFLATEMGFNALALEASYAACQAINDYVLSGKGDRASVLSGQGYIAWDTEEFSAMLDWIRTYNQGVPDEEKVRFYGVDLSNNGLGRASVQDYLSMYVPGWASAADSIFRVLAEVEAKWPMLINDADRGTLRGVALHLEGLINHLVINKAEMVRRSSGVEFDEVLQYIRVMRQFAIAGIAGTNAVRSAYMAENLMYLVDREGPDAKFVIWEHNEHISGKGKETQVAGDSLINPYLGHYLRQQYGRQYYAFGLEFNEGSYQSRVLQGGQAPGDLKEGILPPAPLRSLAWYLSRTEVGDLLLDLRTPPGTPIVERWLDTPQVMHSVDWGYQDPSAVYTELSIRRHYDGLIFFERTTATRPTANAWEAVSKRERF